MIRWHMVKSYVLLQWAISSEAANSGTFNDYPVYGSRLKRAEVVGILTDEDIVCALLRNKGAVSPPTRFSEPEIIDQVLCRRYEEKGENMVLKDLTGKRFGKFVVLERAEDHIQQNGRRRVMWLCQCDCGVQKVVHGDFLKDGRVVSCGCYMRERMHEQFATHHQTDTKLYGIWCAIKRRCYNPNVKYYQSYGGRGIVMCDEWRDNFEAFKSWCDVNGYREGLSIDRIDNDLGYTPENCRWTTKKEQANNRRSNCHYTLNGETHNIRQWADITGLSYSKLIQRYRAGWPAERALTTA